MAFTPVQPDPLSPPFSLGHARIGYDSVLSDAQVTTAARSTIVPATYERWSAGASEVAVYTLPSAKDIDYFAFAAHTIGSSGSSVLIETADTAGGTFTTRATVAPDTDRAVMVLLGNAITVQQARITVSAACDIGVFYAGVALQMQRPIFGGHSPINYSAVTNYNSNASDAGQWLGRDIVRQGLEGSYSWDFLTDDWYREYFQPFVESAKTKPFFISWRPDLYPDEVAYCWTTGDISPSNRGGSTKFMSVGIDVQGYA